MAHVHCTSTRSWMELKTNCTHPHNSHSAMQSTVNYIQCCKFNGKHSPAAERQHEGNNQTKSNSSPACILSHACHVIKQLSTQLWRTHAKATNAYSLSRLMASNTCCIYRWLVIITWVADFWPMLTKIIKIKHYKLTWSKALYPIRADLPSNFKKKNKKQNKTGNHLPPTHLI